MIITEEFLRKYATKGIGFTKKQMEILGVPKKKGWLRNLIGTELPDDKAKLYVREYFNQRSKIRREEWERAFTNVEFLPEDKFKLVVRKLKEINGNRRNN